MGSVGCFPRIVNKTYLTLDTTPSRRFYILTFVFSRTVSPRSDENSTTAKMIKDDVHLELKDVGERNVRIVLLGKWSLEV